MKEELPNEKLREAEDMEIDIKELLFKCLIHWPWFVGTVVACLIAAYVYLYVATPVYNISATVLIKDDKKGGASNNVGGLDELGLSGLITSSQSIDNEIEVLRSKTLVKEVVNYLNLYVTYKDEDLIPSKELYKTSPVQVNMTPQEAEKLKKDIVVEMVVQPQGSLDVNVKMDDREIQKHFEKLPAILPTDRGTISFFQVTDSIPVEGASSVQGARHITATISCPMNVARGYCGNLVIVPTSQTTSVVTVSLKNSSLRRGQDFINQLLEMYNRNTNNDKNEIAQKTAEFIDERIGIISKELGSTEADLETFKRDAGITDLSSDAQIALSGNAEYEKKQVRALAGEFGIPVAHKPDSMEICFIPDKDYISWLGQRTALPGAGDFVFHGEVVGRHDGIYRYTVGQRRPARGIRNSGRIPRGNEDRRGSLHVDQDRPALQGLLFAQAAGKLFEGGLEPVVELVQFLLAGVHFLLQGVQLLFVGSNLGL